MEAKEFDYIYDAEVFRIFNSLPNPKTWAMPTITCNVDLSSINFERLMLNPLKFNEERQDRIIDHTITFKKVFKNNSWTWIRI